MYLQTILLPVRMSTNHWISGKQSVGPDQMPDSVTSDLGLHCLLRHKPRPVWPNTKNMVQYELIVI